MAAGKAGSDIGWAAPAKDGASVFVQQAEVMA
jgi:hypothetical protein